LTAEIDNFSEWSHWGTRWLFFGTFGRRMGL